MFFEIFQRKLGIFMEYYILTPVSFILRVFEVLSHFVLIMTIMRGKLNAKKVFAGAIIFSTLIECIRWIIPQYLVSLLTVFLGTIFIIVFFNLKWWKSIIGYLLLAVITAIVDCITSFSLLKIFNLQELSEIITNRFVYYIDSIIISIILLLLSASIYYFRKKKKTSSDITEDLNMIVLINNIVMFTLLMPNLIMILYYHDNKSLPGYMIIINIVSILIMFYVNTQNTKAANEAIRTEQSLKVQREYNGVLQSLVDDLRTFKHDYNNTLQTIYGYIQLEDMKGLKRFFNQVLTESRNISTLDKMNPNLIKNPGLYSLITNKYQKAKNGGVTMEVELFGDVENLDIQIFDLTRIMGIFLDNSIEAAMGSEKKRINLIITERREDVMIEVINSYSEKQLKSVTLYEKGNSSKGKGRGLGLYKVKEILKKYPKIYHETFTEKEEFMQQLIIEKVPETVLK